MNSPATHPCLGRGASRSLLIRTEVTAGDPGTAPSFPLAERTQRAWESGIGEAATLRADYGTSRGPINDVAIQFSAQWVSHWMMVASRRRW